MAISDATISRFMRTIDNAYQIKYNKILYSMIFVECVAINCDVIDYFIVLQALEIVIFV